MPVFTFRVPAQPFKPKSERRVVSVEPVKGDASASVYAQLIKYDPDTGEFTRLTGPNRHRIAAVHPKSGVVNISNVTERAADIAWLLYTGHRPTGRVYPVNGHVTDLRICNLRMEVEA